MSDHDDDVWQNGVSDGDLATSVLPWPVSPDEGLFSFHHEPWRPHDPYIHPGDWVDFTPFGPLGHFRYLGPDRVMMYDRPALWWVAPNEQHTVLFKRIGV